MDQALSPYVAAITAQLPTLQIDDLRLNSEGMANTVVIVNNELCFRFPKTDSARRLQDYEVKLLEVVRRYVTLAVPTVELHTDEFAMYRYLPGRPLYRHELLRLSPALQAGYAEQLANFLQQLHSIPLHELPAAPWAAPTTSRQQRYLHMKAEIEQTLFGLLWADQRAWINDLFAPLEQGALNVDDYASACIHADLAAYHILHQPSAYELSGVLDFGTAGVGDPASDFALLINVYGEQWLQRIGRFYPLPQDLLERARFLAGYLELEWALNGLRKQDQAWLLVHLGRARDCAPFGTAWRADHPV